ncbi:hypothetical protein [Arthrobacter sp. R4-81]
MKRLGAEAKDLQTMLVKTRQTSGRQCTTTPPERAAGYLKEVSNLQRVKAQNPDGRL